MMGKWKPFGGMAIRCANCNLERGKDSREAEYGLIISQLSNNQYGRVVRVRCNRCGFISDWRKYADGKISLISAIDDWEVS